MKNIVLLFFIAGLFASCAAPVDNSRAKKMADNKALVQRFYETVINGHNVAAIDSFCHADFIDHNPDPGHSGKGLEDLHAQFTAMLAGTPDIHITTDMMVAEGDTVVSFVTVTGTNTGPMADMPATNKPFKINGVDIISLKNGKAVERWGVFDNMSMMAQLGMMGGGAPPEKPKMDDKKGKKK